MNLFECMPSHKQCVNPSVHGNLTHGHKTERTDGGAGDGSFLRTNRVGGRGGLKKERMLQKRISLVQWRRLEHQKQHFRLQTRWKWRFVVTQPLTKWRMHICGCQKDIEIGAFGSINESNPNALILTFFWSNGVVWNSTIYIYDYKIVQSEDLRLQNH